MAGCAQQPGENVLWTWCAHSTTPMANEDIGPTRSHGSSMVAPECMRKCYPHATPLQTAFVRARARFLAGRLILWEVEQSKQRRARRWRSPRYVRVSPSRGGAPG